MILNRFLKTKHATLGQFQCSPADDGFRGTGEAKGHLIVFPREPVTITQTAGNTVVANANIAVFYNRGVEYLRGPISELGDRCDFLDINEQVLTQWVGEFDPAVMQRPDRPFDITHCLIPNQLFVKQRKMFELAKSPTARNTLLISNWVNEIVRGSIKSIYQATGANATTTTSVEHRNLATEAQKYICQNFSSSEVNLQRISQFAGYSKYHLCRIFKKETGIPIHKYLNRLRLRSALDKMRDKPRDLTSVAIDLGFSSHSHFSANFHRAFGVTPSQWRQMIEQ